MKTWTVLYGLVWASFIQILIILFPFLGTNITIGLHVVVGTIVLLLAGYSFSKVRKIACPDRIKRITKTTMILGGVQGILGLALLAALSINAGSTIQTAIIFLHVVNALAIITQAASSATAYDMWEEKEFVTTASPTVP